MDDSLVILGRQPALGIAELESLYGSEKVKLINKDAVQVGVLPCSIDFDRLGGAVKLCKILTILDTVKWQDVQRFLEQTSPQHVTRMPEGKMQLGLSVYGLDISPQQIIATGLSLKKAIRKTGRSVRLTPNKERALNSAQVLHNHLTKDTGWELVFVRDGNKIICAQTLYVQDINSYTIRDRGRPKRDSHVGMLPPKLAQIIINLSVGKQSNDTKQSRILDPFCGTGVLLQEALLMGYEVYGTDLEPRMVEYTNTNLTWLRDRYSFKGAYKLDEGDATRYQWEKPVDFVACETYLGQAFSNVPPVEKLEQISNTCNTIIEKFLVNAAKQLIPNTRLCLGIPAWQTRPGHFIHLPLLDHLDKLGYNRLVLKHVRTDDMIYYREGQIVGRELLLITRK